MADRVKRPSFQFYPGDEEARLARAPLSIEAYGVLKRLQNLMHQSPVYGHLIGPNGKQISVESLARIVRISKSRAARAIAELEDSGYVKRTPDGTLYDQRMVRDEHVRNARAEGGYKSLENENVPRPKGEQANGEGYPSGGPSPHPRGGPPSPSSARSSGGSPSSAAAVAASSAAASPSSSQAERSGDDTGAAPPAPPAAGATREDRPLTDGEDVPAWRAWLTRFARGALPQRIDELERNRALLLGPGYQLRVGEPVLRATPAQLRLACGAMLAAPPEIRSPNGAWPYLLKKIESAPPPGLVEAEQIRTEERRDGAESSGDLAEAESWLAANPDAAQAIEAEVASVVPSDGPLADEMRAGARQRTLLLRYREATRRPPRSVNPGAQQVANILGAGAQQGGHVRSAFGGGQ